jgi:hypothetical protein
MSEPPFIFKLKEPPEPTSPIAGSPPDSGVKITAEPAGTVSPSKLSLPDTVPVSPSGNPGLPPHPITKNKLQHRKDTRSISSHPAEYHANYPPTTVVGGEGAF